MSACEAPPDWYLRRCQLMIAQGLNPLLVAAGPDPLVKPEDERLAREPRQAGRLN